jgi:uncharacterized protein involved in exopolysaccharide biosynthesis
LFTLLKRWYWFLILGLVLGSASGVLISRFQNPVFQSVSKILVMRAPDQSASGLAYLGNQQLALTFSELISIQPVLDDVSNQLGLVVDPTQIQIQQNTNSQIIKVIVEDTDGQRSALIANTMIDTAIKHYVDLQVGQYTSLENDIQVQLNIMQNRMFGLQSHISETKEIILNNQKEQIQSQMTPLQDEVSQLQNDIAQLTPAVSLAQKTLLAEKQTRLDQIQPLLIAYQEAYSNLVVFKKPINQGSIDENNLVLLEATLGVYQQNYVDLTRNLELLTQSHVQGISNVTKIQDASIPDHPIRPQILFNTLLSSAVGFMLAVIAVFMMENLNINLSSYKIFQNWLRLTKINKSAHMKRK